MAIIENGTDGAGALHPTAGTLEGVHAALTASIENHLSLADEDPFAVSAEHLDGLIEAHATLPPLRRAASLT